MPAQRPAPRPAPRAAGRGAPGVVDPAQAQATGGRSLRGGTLAIVTASVLAGLFYWAAQEAETDGYTDRTDPSLLPEELTSQPVQLNAADLTAEQQKALARVYEVSQYGEAVAQLAAFEADDPGLRAGATQVQVELGEHRAESARLLTEAGIDVPEPLMTEEAIREAGLASPENAEQVLAVVFGEELPLAISYLQTAGPERVRALASAIQLDIDAATVGAAAVDPSSTTSVTPGRRDVVSLAVFAMRYDNAATSVTAASWTKNTHSYVVKASAAQAVGQLESSSPSGARGPAATQVTQQHAGIVVSL